MADPVRTKIDDMYEDDMRRKDWDVPKFNEPLRPRGQQRQAQPQPDISRIKRNVSKMATQGAPVEDIDGYIASEGVTVEQVKAHKPAPALAQAAPAPVAELPGYPSVYDRYPEVNQAGGMAATLGSSDAALGDVYKNQLGDRFIRAEKVSRAADPSGPGDNRPGNERDQLSYDVIVTRGPDGKEQYSYVNKPGLDMEDVSRGIRGALPYFVTGGATAAATRAAPLLVQAAALGASDAATSVAGDALQAPLGSEQGIDTNKALGMGLMGVGIPLASRAVGNVAGALRDRMAPQTGPLANMSPKAVRNIEASIAADPTLTQQSMRAIQNTYGDQTMLADMGHTLQGDAAMLARTPEAKDIAATNIAGRQAGAPQRLQSALNTEIGPERNLPQFIEQQARNYNARAKPFYDQFRNTPVNPTPELANILEAAKASGAYDRAMKKLMVKRLDPNAPQNNGQFLDLIKRELDGMASQAKTNGNRTDFADYSALAADLRKEVDSILSPSNPAASSWAQGRAIAGEGIEGREAADLGAQVFGTQARDPHVVQSDMASMSAHGKQLYKEGARNKLRQIMGKSASNFGPKGDAAARRALNSEFARENLDQIIGPNGAQRLTDVVDAENQFARLHDMALSNSVTDTMQAARRRWAPHAQSDFASEAGKKGPIGLATEYTLKIADALIGGQIKKSEARAMIDGAKMLTARGRDRARIVDALFKHMEARNAGRLSGQKFEKIVRGLLETSRTQAVQQYQNAN